MPPSSPARPRAGRRQARRQHLPRLFGIPSFPSPGVTGHGGTLHAGRLSGRRVLVFEGRSHAYETGNAAVMKVPLGVAKALGVPLLLLTNAAGSLMAQAGPGSLVAVADHINLSGLNPLIGETGDGRFVPLVSAYDSAARETLHEAARECGFPCITESMHGSRGQASRLRPRSVWRGASAPIWWACRQFRR